MQRSRFQLILGIPHDRQVITEIQRHMATFATFFIHPTGKPALFGEPLHLANELASLSSGEYRTSVSEKQWGLPEHCGMSHEPAEATNSRETASFDPRGMKSMRPTWPTPHQMHSAPLLTASAASCSPSVNAT